MQLLYTQLLYDSMLKLVDIKITGQTAMKTSTRQGFLENNACSWCASAPSTVYGVFYCWH